MKVNSFVNFRLLSHKLESFLLNVDKINYEMDISKIAETKNVWPKLPHTNIE